MTVMAATECSKVGGVVPAVLTALKSERCATITAPLIISAAILFVSLLVAVHVDSDVMIRCHATT
jgi:hypothetical protein